MSTYLVRPARIEDAHRLESLLHEWLNWEPRQGRIGSILRGIRNKEFLVAEADARMIGLIHFVLHGDVIDGAPNAFVTAFYVQAEFRRKGIGTKLLNGAITESARRGATFVETSTLRSEAKSFYEKNGFTQAIGEIGEIFLELDVEKHRGAR